jgi:hypothetical protein
MPIGDAFRDSEVSGCCGCAARSWSGGINIYMIAAGCAACTCAGGRTFSNGWWCTRERRIWDC